MKTKIFFLSIICFCSLIMQAQKEIVIGKQVWMSKNLNVDRFQNGDLIPEAKTREQWEIASKELKPAWCYFDNNPDNGEKYGRLYNYYAIIDPRGLAPKGWRIADDEDWKSLEREIGLTENQIDLEEFPDDWEKNNITYDRGQLLKIVSRINNMGIEILLGGFRGYDGTFLLFDEEISFFSPRYPLDKDWVISRSTRNENICRATAPGGSGMYIKIVR